MAKAQWKERLSEPIAARDVKCILLGVPTLINYFAIIIVLENQYRDI